MRSEKPGVGPEKLDQVERPVAGQVEQLLAATSRVRPSTAGVRSAASRRAARRRGWACSARRRRRRPAPRPGPRCPGRPAGTRRHRCRPGGSPACPRRRRGPCRRSWPRCSRTPRPASTGADIAGSVAAVARCASPTPGTTRQGRWRSRSRWSAPGSRRRPRVRPGKWWNIRTRRHSR